MMKTQKKLELTALLSSVFGSTAVSLVKDLHLKPKHAILMLGIAIMIVGMIGIIAGFILFCLVTSPLMLSIMGITTVAAPLIFAVGMAVVIFHDQLTSLPGRLLDYLSTGIKHLINLVRRLNLTSPANLTTNTSIAAVILMLFGVGLLVAGMMISMTSIAAIITSLSLICGGFVIIAIGGRLHEHPESVGEMWESLPSIPSSISSYFKAGDALGAELSDALNTGLVMEPLDPIYEIGSDSDIKDNNKQNNLDTNNDTNDNTNTALSPNT